MQRLLLLQNAVRFCVITGQYNTMKNVLQKYVNYSITYHSDHEQKIWILFNAFLLCYNEGEEATLIGNGADDSPLHNGGSRTIN
jgi:hypothetical protein